ncbi:TPA: hypothetical protein ACOJPC_004169 [Vibrio fluvialis]|nr:hypothetical protein [Vibrio fluvialis]EKO3478001.1 hypothetical protein [Vibrio fluvialis]
MSLTLHGVMTETLGGFRVLRGFAKLSDLAACSFADDYQRDLKPKHQQDIQAYYQRGEYLFFPEVVLALELQVDYEKNGAPSADPMQLLMQGLPFKSNVNGISLRPTKTKMATELTRVNLTLPTEAGTPLKRIDGNHRISAFEALTDKALLDAKPVSFCILLLPQSSAKQSEKALFYNINSKALPLTSEEVYKGIIDDETGFPYDVLVRDFGAEFVLCRALRKRLDFDYLPHLRRVFGQLAEAQELADTRCSLLIESLRDWQAEQQRLNLDASLPSEAALLQAIQRINTSYAPRYEGDARLQRCAASGLFSAFLYFALSDTTQTAGQQRFAQFENWVLRNHQYELQRINALDLIRIFEKVAQARSRQIFVSMQFSANTQANFTAIQNAVNDLNSEHKLDIQLRPIRIDQFDTGYSYEINDEILRLIEESGYLIADLTCGNKNVYHEIGYLMGLNQGKGLKHENFLLLHNGGISDAKADVGFNLTAIKQLRVNDTNSLREQVKRQIAVFYGLDIYGQGAFHD